MAGEAFTLLVHVALQVTVALSRESEEWMRNVTMLCPYTDFCQVKASEAFEHPDGIPCCLPCSCEEDCWEKQQCCPDKVNMPTKASEVTCKSMLVKDTLYAEKQTSVGYLIVDNCPAQESNVDLKRKCLGPGFSLEDFVWVSDPSTGKIFQNQHCALCHGVTHWKRWNVRTSCIQSMDYTNLDDLAKILLSDDCSISNTADGLLSIPINNTCYVPDISICNQTGLWNDFDRGLEEACRRHTVPFVEYDLGDMWIYKNAFCYLCNQPRAHTSNTICYAKDNDFKTTMTGNTGINILINFQELENMKEPNYLCAVNELRDKYTNRCWKLICPFGSASAYGECRSKSTDNLGLLVGLNLGIVWNETTFNQSRQIEFTEKNGKDMFEAVTKMIGLKKCTLCSGEVTIALNGTKVRRPVTEFIVWLRYSTNSDCGLNVMYQHIGRSVGQTVTVTVNYQERMILIISFETRPFSETRKSAKLFLKNNPRYCLNTVIRQVKKECPEIELVLSEVMSETNEKVRDVLLPLFNKSGIGNASTTLICVDDYFKRMPKKSVNRATRIETLVAFLSFLSVMFLLG